MLATRTFLNADNYSFPKAEQLLVSELPAIKQVLNARLCPKTQTIIYFQIAINHNFPKCYGNASNYNLTSLTFRKASNHIFPKC